MLFAVGAQLLGRQREREVLGGLLDAARGGDGAALVVHGEPGVGKTALLDWTVEEGRQLRVAPDRRGRGGDGAPVRGASAAVLADPRLERSVCRIPSATRSASPSG